MQLFSRWADFLILWFLSWVFENWKKVQSLDVHFFVLFYKMHFHAWQRNSSFLFPCAFDTIITKSMLDCQVEWSYLWELKCVLEAVTSKLGLTNFLSKSFFKGLFIHHNNAMPSCSSVFQTASSSFCACNPYFHS